MRHHRVRRAMQTAAIALSFIFVFAIVALAQDAQVAQAAQDGRANRPGQFDYYVLSLSWSPSYCAGAAERRSRRYPDPQCSGRPFAFIVHGLWPQFVKGFPSNCLKPAPRIDRTLVSGMLDLMPSRHLIYHEWDSHGTCSGLSAPAFFALVRKARARVKIPDVYRDPEKPLDVSPATVAAAFIKANPGLAADDMAITCNLTRLSEVRLCMSKDLSFHDCPAVAKRGCKRDQIVMPALRAGSNK